MYRYICNILLLVLLASGSVYAQADSAMVAPTVVSDSASAKVNSDKSGKKTKKASSTPVFQGVYLGVDIFNPIATAWRDYGQFNIVADVSLWHRLFPTVEFGMQFAKRNTDDYQYKSQGMYLRFGFNYNFLNYKNERTADHVFAAGIRYAYSNVGYDLSNVSVTDGYWGSSATMSAPHHFDHAGWVEFLLIIRVQIYKGFFMGVTGRVMTFPHFYNTSVAYYPGYLPGFGAYSSDATNFGLDYTLTYQIPYKKKKNQ